MNPRTGPLGRPPTGWLPAAFPAAPLWAGVAQPWTQFSPHHRRGRFSGKSEAEVLPDRQITCLTGTLQEPEPRISSSWIYSQNRHRWNKARSCLDCLAPEPRPPRAPLVQAPVAFPRVAADTAKGLPSPRSVPTTASGLSEPRPAGPVGETVTPTCLPARHRGDGAGPLQSCSRCSQGSCSSLLIISHPNLNHEGSQCSP